MEWNDSWALLSNCTPHIKHIKKKNLTVSHLRLPQRGGVNRVQKWRQEQLMFRGERNFQKPLMRWHFSRQNVLKPTLWQHWRKSSWQIRTISAQKATPPSTLVMSEQAGMKQYSSKHFAVDKTFWTIKASVRHQDRCLQKIKGSLSADFYNRPQKGAIYR